MSAPRLDQQPCPACKKDRMVLSDSDIAPLHGTCSNCGYTFYYDDKGVKHVEETQDRRDELEELLDMLGYGRD